jgi:pimeloyl-ACP methyl ester carboxylesterase
MTTFVLVPGMWLGGWAWREVAAVLAAGGHSVYPLTLTGLGDRVHLGGPQVNLDTHIADVVNVLQYEELEDVVLVGHSFGGSVITCAAEAAPERVARLVYVDTWPLPHGVAQSDLNGPEGRETQVRQVMEEGEGWRLPLPPWEELDQGNELMGLGAAERARMRAKATDQPYGTVIQPVHLPHGVWASRPKTAIWCSMSVEEVRGLMEAYPQVTSTLQEGEWEFVELPTGHWPMFSKAQELGEMLGGMG